MRWSHPSTTAALVALTLTYLPPQPSALAGGRPYLLTPRACCGTDLRNVKKNKTRAAIGVADHSRAEEGVNHPRRDVPPTGHSHQEVYDAKIFPGQAEVYEGESGAERLVVVRDTL